ncbi:MAG: cytochrome c biogenesis protein CcsA [Ignavibacteriales bacterium]|nr:cytochrome c biogenesis protein CcsA [Ignavibacteriales bacterium]
MIGNILLTLGLIAGVFTVVMYYLTYRGYQNTLSLARIGFHTTAIMVIASAALLLYAVLTHQYQYKYIYNYSGSDLPTGLLMSTFYAGQEGSFMLWTFFTAVIGLVLLDYTSKRGDLEPRVMMTFSLVLSFLLIMVSPLLKSPFNFIWMDNDFIDLKNINQAFLSLPALQSFIFSDPQANKQFVQMGKELHAVLVSNNISVNDFIIQGKGLNPLLQNFWMQIHPPILFIGFSMSAVPFSFALAAILKNEYRDWVKQAMPWILAGTCILGLAIMLGGYWAYSILGWGGYWGWDPVENSSLIPWIVGVASIHTILVQKKTQEKGGGSRFVKTNLILSIMTFVLVLYSTFLTRSGILGDASVHSFAEPGMAVYLFLIIFLAFFAIIGIGGIVYRWEFLTEHFSFEENILSRELALFTGSVALIASAIIIAVGTSAPIFGTTVQTSFYNELNLPIAIIIGFLNGTSILLKWKHTEGKQLWKQSQFAVIATVVLTLLVIFIGGVHQLMLIILTLSSSFAFFVNSEIAYKIFRGKKSHLGAYVAHIGISLFLIGVLATAGHSQQKQVDLVKGQKVNVLGHELTFTGYTTFDNGKKYHMNIEVKDGNNVRIVSPIMFIAEFNNSLMREPDILVGLTKDFYVAPVSYSDNQENPQGTPATMKGGDKVSYEGREITFNKFVLPKDMSAMSSGAKFRIGVDMTVAYQGKEYKVEPYMENEGQGPTYFHAELKDADLKISIASMNATNAQVSLLFSSISKGQSVSTTPKEILTVDASVKPFISLVWIGVLTMVTGFIIASFRRSKESLV